MKIYWSNWFQDYIFQNAFPGSELPGFSFRHKLKIYKDEDSPKHTEYWEAYSGHEDDLIFICEVEQ